MAGLLRSSLAAAVVWALVSLWVFRSVDTSGHRPAHARFRRPGGAAVEALRSLDAFDFEAALGRLARALRIKTVSRERGVVSHPEGFLAMHALLRESFPAVHEAAPPETVGNYSLLFHWRGSERGSLLPVLLASHLDTVPVDRHDLDQWDFEPFAGHIVNVSDPETGTRRFIYGRGTMDDKMGVLSLLEAAEDLLKRGFRPRRSVYFFFGHDEEVGGAAGARAAAALLEGRGVRLHAVVDEGGLIGDGLLPGVAGEVGLIGIGEKGYADVELAVRNTGGHSAAPPLPPTAVGRLAAALARLEANQFPAHLEVMTDTVRHLGGRAPLLWRLAFSNLPVFRPLLERVLTSKRTVASTVRTTIAPTRLEGSEKSNVLPTAARAVVNFRIMAPDTVKSVLEHVRRVVSDPHVEVRLVDGGQGDDPLPPSPTDGDAYAALAATAAELWPDRAVAPYLCPGMTDSRHFHRLTPNLYRFIPFVANADDVKRFHGISERVSVADAERCVRFYHRLILNFAA